MELPDPICEAYQIRDYRPSESIMPGEQCRVFHVRVELEFIHLVDDTTEEFEDLVTETHEETRVFPIRTDWLLHHPTIGKDTAWAVLEEMGIPRHQEYEFMAQRILKQASFMASDECNRDLEVLPMGVFISCIKPRGTEALNEVGMDDGAPQTTVSVSKSAMKGSKKVMVGLKTNRAHCPHCRFELN